MLALRLALRLARVGGVLTGLLSSATNRALPWGSVLQYDDARAGCRAACRFDISALNRFITS